jgi:hypothetical protein
MFNDVIPMYCNSSEAEREEAITEIQELVPDASLEELLKFLKIRKLLEKHNNTQLIKL